MGTTFTNLQIKTGEQGLPELDLVSGFCSVRTAQDWYTIYEKDGQHDFKRMQSLGRKLSKKIEMPVLVVSYFDDDMFEIILLKSGNTVGFYRLCGAQIFSEKPKSFISELGLLGKEATAFRYLLKKEMSVPVSIDAFSRLLGAKLYTDWKLKDECEVLWQKDAGAVIADMEAEKKSTKVKNQTDLVLREEINGMVIQDGDEREWYEDTRERIFRVAPLVKNGDASQIVCYQEIGGAFKKVHEYQYPEEVFPKEALQLTVDTTHRMIMLWLDDGDCCCMDELELDRYKEFFSNLRRVPKEEKEMQGDLPCVSSLSGNRSRIGAYEYIYFGQGVIYKVDWNHSCADGYEENTVAKYIYEGAGDAAWWSDFYVPPVIVRDKILVVRLLYSRPGAGGRDCLDVRFFDTDLKLLRKELVPVDKNSISYSRHYTYNEELDVLYFGEEMVHLNTHEVSICPTKVEAGIVLGHLDARKNVYMVKGHSLYIFSSQMKLLSHHKFKGESVVYYMNEKGNMCLITNNAFVDSFAGVKADSALRLYEVVWKDEIGWSGGI